MANRRITTITITDEDHDHTLSDGDLENMVTKFWESYLKWSEHEFWRNGLKNSEIRFQFELLNTRSEP
jgi:hypothetical protein